MLVCCAVGKETIPYEQTKTVRRRHGTQAGRRTLGGPDRGGPQNNGDSIFRYIYADTQKELTAKLRQNIDAYQGIDLTEQSRMTLSEWLDQWLDRRMAGTVRSDTLDGYRRDLNNHVKPRLGQKQLTKLHPLI